MVWEIGGYDELILGRVHSTAKETLGVTAETVDQDCDVGERRLDFAGNVEGVV